LWLILIANKKHIAFCDSYKYQKLGNSIILWGDKFMISNFVSFEIKRILM